jgi:hypothetical protein
MIDTGPWSNIWKQGMNLLTRVEHILMLHSLGKFQLLTLNSSQRNALVILNEHGRTVT